MANIVSASYNSRSEILTLKVERLYTDRIYLPFLKKSERKRMMGLTVKQLIIDYSVIVVGIVVVVLVVATVEENLSGNCFTIPSTRASDIMLASWRTLSYVAMSAA